MLGRAERRERFASYMGRVFETANPDAREMWREGGASSACACFAPAEQRIGGSAVGGSPIMVSARPRNLRFEQRNPLRQFRLRVGSEIFARKAARCIALGPRQIAFFHQAATSQGNRLAVNP